jgi:tRNA nucleotidyltransferase/poly(A) polymerase
MPDLPSLKHAPWLAEPTVQGVLAMLVGAGGEARVAGGAVRNALLNEAVADIDIATTLTPEQVMAAAKAQGFPVYPTGLAHGTVTVNHRGRTFEVTTLRRDVKTDGRHADVVFTDDWVADANRRDFTVNALYCDAGGKIYDFTDGYGDLLKRRIKFVGRPEQRIKEDYLRILRFFRFQARYGRGAPHRASLAACVALRRGLAKLSPERVQQELLKLLVAPRAVPVLRLMARHGVLRVILPHTEEWRVLGRLPDDAVLRLAVLAKAPGDLQARLHLSNAQAERLQGLATAPALSPKLRAAERRAILYHLGPERWRDAARLAHARSRAAAADPAWLAFTDLPAQWQAPKFPLSGRDLLAHGFQPGPRLGAELRFLEDMWVASDFTLGHDALLMHVTGDAP